MLDTKEKTIREKWAKRMAGIRKILDKTADDLDKAGIESKDMHEEDDKILSPDDVEALRAALGESLSEEFPVLMEDDGAGIDAIISAIADVVIQPSEIEEEETALDENDKQDEEEEDEEEKSMDAEILQKIDERMTSLESAISGMVKDAGDLVELSDKAINTNTEQSKLYKQLLGRIDKMEKAILGRPRRATQSPETEVDPESDIGKALAEKMIDLSNVPATFRDMFKNGGQT